MALDSGKKQVKLKTISSNVPYVPAKSNFSIAVDAFAPTLKRLQRDADATAHANYFHDFQIKTREFFEKARLEHEADPNGMKATVDTYSKNLLDKVPPAYKIQANAMLSSYSQNSITFAAKNKTSSDNAKLFNDYEVKWENVNTEMEFAMNNFTDMPVELSIKGINDTFINNLLTINELSHDDFESMVKTRKITDKDHLNNIKNNIEAALVARGFNTMKSMYKNGMEVEALEWLQFLKEGNDKTSYKGKAHPIYGEQHKDNPVFKMADDFMKDDQDRIKIIDTIWKQFQDFNSETIFGKPKKIKPNIKELSEINQPLDIANFKGGFKDVNKIAADNNLELTDELITYVSKANNTQRVVSKTMQYPNKIINWADEGVTPAEWGEAILANNNIRKVKYSDLKSDGFITAINLFDGQDYYPPELANALKLNKAADYRDPPSLEKLKEQTEIYKYVKNFFPDIEYPGLYEQALSEGVIDEISNKNYDTATNILNGIGNDDKVKRLASIVNNENSTKNFRQLFNSKVASPNWIPEMMAGGKGELNKHLFTAADQSTFFAMIPSNITPPAAYTQFQGFFNEALANMTRGNEIDPWKDGNENLRDQAWNIATRKLKQSGWGIETHTSDGKPKLVKDPIWKTYPSIGNDDIYAHVKKSFMTAGGDLKHSEEALTEAFNKAYIAEQKSKINTFQGMVTSPADRLAAKAESKKLYEKFDKMKAENANLYQGEKGDKFGTNDWNDIQEILNKYFDNKNNENVKISIDRQMYNDENNRPAYKLTLWDGDFMIPIEGNFKPIGWTNYSKAPIPGAAQGSMATLINDTANKIYEEMGTTVSFHGKEYERSDWSKRFLHSVIRNSLKLSDYRFYPDIPGLNDLPTEVRPFAFLARQLGFDGDFREIATELSSAAKTANESISEQKKINLNRDLSNLEKVTSAAVPPEKMVLSENAMSLNFKNYALENYNNTELRLSHRTNNWTSISSDNWDGEIDLNYKRDSRHFAVFSHPKDSIRAATRLFLNHSILTQALNAEKIPTEYGSEPTISDILTKTKYATDMESYFEALDNHPTLSRDTTIDLMDSNQMHKLLKFITKHEMGVDYFNEKFGINNPYVDAVIFRGIDEAINSYNGELGKL